MEYEEEEQLEEVYSDTCEECGNSCDGTWFCDECGVAICDECAEYGDDGTVYCKSCFDNL